MPKSKSKSKSKTVLLCITPSTGVVRRYIGPARDQTVVIEPNDAGRTAADVLPQILDELEYFRKWGITAPLGSQTS